ncbi:NADP-dependent oxidoreductase domain-containing protein [Umbelopsis sp. PMI_123]|nr:NADP-dependent oxidoreductase domain-containing protein [Umbelopsis sp. PMI_123]
MSLTKSFKLNTGADIPAIGLGTWQSKPEEVYTAVKTAITSGYRHIDTAYAYGNEDAVGRGIKDGLKEVGLKREDIFVTTKLWSTFHRPADVQKGLDESLASLGLEYIDLYLMHWPVALTPGKGTLFPRHPDGTRDRDPELNGDFTITYAAMEKLVETGKTKAIGVSNFSTHNLDTLLKSAKIVPAVNQVELHPYLPQNKLHEYCTAKGIHLTAYSPLGSTDSPLQKEPVLIEIAERNNKSVAQTLISWAVQRGTSVLPKSVTPSRITANFQDYKLSDEDFAKINEISSKHSQRLVEPDWGVTVFHDDE